MRILLLVLGLVTAEPALASAAGLDEAETRYAQGDMAGAASVARSLATAKGFALAARATLVEAIYLSPDGDKQALVERAAADAEAALAHDPNYVDAQLQLAIALGQLADLEDPLSAHVNGYAKRGKALIDRALAFDPDNEWAHALLGMWHLRIVQRAGDALAASLYGASRKTGIELCAQAMAAPHEAFALKYGCARTLFELDPDQFAGTAEQTLAAVKQADAYDAADRLVQAAAGRLLAELETTRPQ
jgi:Regulator of microtubule dynamics protein 1-3